MPTGLDYSAGTISGAAIRAAGHTFVLRYLDDPRYAGTKHLTPAELADLTAAGVQTWCVFEQDTTDMLGGFAAGVANAHRAVAGAVWCGYRGLIFMAADMHLDDPDHPEWLPAALAYLDGAASVLGSNLTGCYGFPELIAAARAGGHARAFWQAGHDPGPLGDAHIWQCNTGGVTVAGVACDVNILYAPIPAPGGPPVVPPRPTRRRLEDPVTAIPIVVQPDGTFRATAMCESGGGSQVVAQAWLDLGSTWGSASFRATALSPTAITCLYPAGSPPGQLGHIPNNAFIPGLALPQGTCMVTVEGRVDDPTAGTIPAASVVSLPR